jgi:orotidine-5'-phosphate decarboxylase
MASRDRICVALDVPSLSSALRLVKATQGLVGTYKVGWGLIFNEGPQVVQRVREKGGRVFVDVKLHDIPSTMEGSIGALSRLGADYITVHAAAGTRALMAAGGWLSEQTVVPGASRTRLLGITVMSSLDDKQAEAVGFRGTAGETSLRLAKLSREAHLDGVVCSPQDAAAIRRACGRDFFIACAGIRPAGVPQQDQARAGTLQAAMAGAADMVIIGRAITTAPDPRKVIEKLVADMEGKVGA